MHVKLVSYTVPVPSLQEEGIKTSTDLIAYVARVSNPGNQFNPNSDKLIHYLIEHQHWSPLEMIDVTVEVKTTRDIGRQILRHWSFSFQEFSQRYAEATEFETREARLQDKKNRQNSIATTDEALQAEWERLQLEIIDNAKTVYKWALDNGVAREQARAVLPEGLTRTTMYMKASLRDWVHYISLRTGNGTQKEHMLIAKEAANVIREVFPMITDFVTQ
jgi:thymidylate synthase (FAD)